jgi:AcrR family transcriptional regulator
VAAAIAVADREGLEAVSMARVAAEAGAAPMSLYRHVASKDELLDLMTDTAWGPPRDISGETWRDKLSAWAWGMRDALQKHPWALRVPVSGLPVYPNNAAWFEQGLAATDGTSLTVAHKASVILLISGYVRNEAMTSADIAASIRARAGDASDAGSGSGSGSEADEQWMHHYRDLMAKLTDPVRFPATTQLLESGVFDVADDPDDEFIFGLNRILDGIGLLVESGYPRPSDGPSLAP